MTAEPIEDPESLPGRELYDGLGHSLGEIESVIEAEEGDEPRWVALKVRRGMLGGDCVVIPLARIKEEDGRLGVPYSNDHILSAPNPDDPNDMSDEDEAELMGYYGVERGDQPPVESYSTQGTREIKPEDIGEPVGDPEDEGEEAENTDRSEPADSDDDDDDDDDDEADEDEDDQSQSPSDD